MERISAFDTEAIDRIVNDYAEHFKMVVKSHHPKLVEFWEYLKVKETVKSKLSEDIMLVLTKPCRRTERRM